MDAVNKSKVAERFLDHLINPDDCVGTFGRSYIDDLELIAVENHGYDTETNTFTPYPDMITEDEPTQAWFERACKEMQITTMAEFIAYVRAHLHEIDLATSRPRVRSEELYETDAFTDLRTRSTESIEKLNNLQREWSRDNHKTSQPLNETDADNYEYYMGWDRISPWTFLIQQEIKRGTLKTTDKCVCIGNRWSGEVRYFRDNIGLKNTIGVDLFSADPEFVIAADMHKMPFEDGSVKLVFARGVANKSYDFRVWLRELRRVLAPDGFLIIEQPLYNHGVDILGATDLKSSKNLLRLLRGKIKRIAYTDDVEGHYHQWTYHDFRLCKIFVQLDPNGPRDFPKVEPFPHVRFHISHYLRTKMLERRILKRYGYPTTPYDKTPKPFKPRLSWER